MASSLTLGSTDNTMFCHLCPAVRASAYCMECRIYLCPSCEGQHKNYPTFQDHRLLTGGNMPSFHPTGHGTGDINKCSEHPQEEIREYDLQRDALGETLLKNKDGMAQLVTSPGITKRNICVMKLNFNPKYSENE